MFFYDIIFMTDFSFRKKKVQFFVTFILKYIHTQIYIVIK